jgi:hypothetical protein
MGHETKPSLPATRRVRRPIHPESEPGSTSIMRSASNTLVSPSVKDLEKGLSQEYHNGGGFEAELEGVGMKRRTK